MFYNKTYVILLINLSLELVSESEPIQGCTLKLRNNKFWQLCFTSFFWSCFLISILISSSCFSYFNFLRNSTSCSWPSLCLDFAYSPSSNSWIAPPKLNITLSNCNIFSCNYSVYASIALAFLFLSFIISCTLCFKSCNVSILVSILALHFSSFLCSFLYNNLLLSVSPNVSILILFSIQIFVCSKLSAIVEKLSVFLIMFIK